MKNSSGGDLILPSPSMQLFWTTRNMIWELRKQPAQLEEENVVDVRFRAMNWGRGKPQGCQGWNTLQNKVRERERTRESTAGRDFTISCGEENTGSDDTISFFLHHASLIPTASTVWLQRETEPLQWWLESPTLNPSLLCLRGTYLQGQISLWAGTEHISPSFYQVYLLKSGPKCQFLVEIGQSYFLLFFFFFFLIFKFYFFFFFVYLSSIYIFSLFSLHLSFGYQVYNFWSFVGFSLSLVFQIRLIFFFSSLLSLRFFSFFLILWIQLIVFLFVCFSVCIF